MGLEPSSYEVTAPQTVGTLWAISSSRRQITRKASQSHYGSDPNRDGPHTSSQSHYLFEDCDDEYRATSARV